MLKETEWNTINNMLLELYTLQDLNELSKKILHMLRMLIPFTKGYFILLDEKQKILKDYSYFLDMDEEFKNKYISDFYDKDYLKYLYEFTQETTVYQDTTIIDDTVRKTTDFYQKFLKPSDIPYGAGILIVHDHNLLGIFNLFRSNALGDFSPKDIYILKILKKHIENMLFNVTMKARQNGMQNIYIKKAKETFSLSDREVEILKLICDGKSNSEICGITNISISTVKKHVYNIFNKTGVSSRTQLLNLLYTSEV